MLTHQVTTTDNCSKWVCQRQLESKLKRYKILGRSYTASMVFRSTNDGNFLQRNSKLRLVRFQHTKTTLAWNARRLACKPRLPRAIVGGTSVAYLFARNQSTLKTHASQAYRIHQSISETNGGWSNDRRSKYYCIFVPPSSVVLYCMLNKLEIWPTLYHRNIIAG
ncbi:hypothetical protein BDZ45DRAFT_76319 [Acephala macrosclerotiorum]|nr:hypothetical protein BDZ45DRAFT_76319 [Acephala macrosclerotiorum]